MDKYIIKKKIPINFSNQEIDVMSRMCFNFNNAILEGSAGFRSQQYPADRDLFETVVTKYSNIFDCLDYLQKEFQKIIRQLMDSNGIYIGDIKCGQHKNEPVRWKPKQILQGYQMIGNVKYSLKDGFIAPAMTKLDVIAYINGVFTDFSIIYVFQNNGKILNNYDQGNITKALTHDAKEYQKEGNYYKSAKRLFAIAIFEKKKSIIKKLTTLFNSNLGLMYQVISNIDTMLFIFENYNNIAYNKINFELDNFITKLSNIYQINEYLIDDEKYMKMIKRLEALPKKKSSNKTYETVLTKIRNRLNEILQSNTLKYLKENID